jgi:hypothetical protein
VVAAAKTTSPTIIATPLRINRHVFRSPTSTREFRNLKNMVSLQEVSLSSVCSNLADDPGASLLRAAFARPSMIQIANWTPAGIGSADFFRPSPADAQDPAAIRALRQKTAVA